MASNKGGRPSKFDKIDTTLVKRLIKGGFTDKQMALVLGINEGTWYNWKKKNQKFFKAVKSWKDEADENVERAMYERACGYSHDDVHISNYQGQITVTEIRKHYPPDTTAGIFWLCNRQGDRWKRNLNVQHDLSNKAAEFFQQLSEG